MMKVYKGTDLKLGLLLKDALGTPYRLAKTSRFDIKFFTTDPDVCAEAWCFRGRHKGIVEGEHVDYIVLDASDLEAMDEGVLNFSYRARFASSDFEDGYYDETGKRQTDMFLKSNLTCSCNE